MNNLYQRFNDIINPGFKYFSAESEEFRQGKQEFESAIEQGDASVFVDVLEEEYAHIRTTGSNDYKISNSLPNNGNSSGSVET